MVWIHCLKGYGYSLESREMVKAVMVYIKVVLKPPSASHNSEAIQEAQEMEKKICIAKKNQERDKAYPIRSK